MVSETYKNTMATLPCEDVAPSNPKWTAFLDSFDTVTESWPAAERAPMQTLVMFLRLEGCSVFSKTNYIGSVYYSWRSDPCREWGEGGWNFQTKPLSIFCPVSCGCRGGDPHCPDMCPANATHWWDRPIS